MKTFPEFCKEAYDASFMSGAQVRQSGEGGRVGRERKKTPAEIRKVSQPKAGGERKPAEYKPRKDIGTQKQADTRVQQPEQERGSAAVRERAAAAAKEERRKLAKERAAAKSGGETPKPKSSDLIKQATKILSKTKPAEVDKRPKDQPKRPAKRKVRVGPEYEGLTPREADKVYKRKIKSAGRKLLKSINPRIKDDEQSKKARS